MRNLMLYCAAAFMFSASAASANEAQDQCDNLDVIAKIAKTIEGNKPIVLSNGAYLGDINIIMRQTGAASGLEVKPDIYECSVPFTLSIKARSSLANDKSWHTTKPHELHVFYRIMNFGDTVKWNIESKSYDDGWNPTNFQMNLMLSGTVNEQDR